MIGCFLQRDRSCYDLRDQEDSHDTIGYPFDERRQSVGVEEEKQRKR